MDDLKNNPIFVAIRETIPGNAIELPTALLPELARLVSEGVLRRLNTWNPAEYMVRGDLIQSCGLFHAGYRIVHRIEPGEVYAGWVTSGDDPENWWEDAETACEWYDDRDLDRPAYLFGSTPVYAELSVDQVIEDLCERLADEGPIDWDFNEIRDKLDGIEELKKAILAFNAANASDPIFYSEDRSVRVYLHTRPAQPGKETP